MRRQLQAVADRLGVADRISDLRRSVLTPADVPPGLDDGPYECLHTDVGEVWMSVADEVIRPYLRNTGTWEAAEGRLLKSLIRPGCRFLDIGANVGYFSLFASKAASGVRIDAVEPLPTNLGLLRFNLWANHTPDVTVWPLALSDGARSVAMTVTPTNLGDARTEAIGDVDHFDLVVPAIAGNELFCDRSFDVVKIDVQGFEFEVLVGMTEVFARSPGAVVVAEFWASRLRERGLDPVEVLANYRRLGFSFDTQVDERVAPMSDDEIVRTCDTAGVAGQVNLVMRYQRRA